jgi:hypothetical protein
MFSQSYKNILIQFLRGIIESERISEAWKNRDEINSIFYSVIHKITEKCEEKSLEILGNLNKDLLIKTYDILYKYSSIFRISDEFVLKVQKMVEDLLKNDECIILNPTLEDLFEKNIYKLIIRRDVGGLCPDTSVGMRERQSPGSIVDTELLIPLWHHELVYEIAGVDIYVKCIPILPENYRIDSDNNIIIELEYNINELLDMTNLKLVVGNIEFIIPVEKLKISSRQTLVLNGVGIPRIINSDIYSISKIGDIILDISLFTDPKKKDTQTK